MSKGLKIVQLKAENIKKIIAVEITPNGNMVQITGKNGSGKTSVLDSIWWALGGTSNVQKVPIRKGQTKGSIRLDLGEYVVTRTFRNVGEGNVTSSIKVENKEGARFASPQGMLDKLLGQLSFDPLAFARMDSKAQFQTLRSFVPDVDFDAIDEANREDFRNRTDLNRRAKEAKTFASQIIVAKEIAAERMDESALVDELEAAATTNADIETRKANRAKMAERITQCDIQAQAAKAEAKKRAKEFVTGAKEQADQILASAEKGFDRIIKDGEKKVGELEHEAGNLEVKLKGAKPLPKPVDVADLRQRIEKAKSDNQQLDAVEKRDAHASNADLLEAQAKKLTGAIEKRNTAKEAAVAAAKIPVDGISFGDGEVLLQELPFDQASDAEQLRASIAIAMAMNPELKIIRIRDGSLMDSNSMKILSDMVDEKDYQAWIERADESGKVGFVMEDGQLKNKVKKEVASGKR